MDDLVALPPAQLAAQIMSYGLLISPVEKDFVDVNGRIAFNLDGCPLVLDGRERPEPALMCVTSDPLLLPYSKGAGSILTVQLMPGAFYRLFGTDLTGMNGVRAVDAAIFPAVAQLGSCLQQAASDWPTISATLNAAFAELSADARPLGFAENFFAMVSVADGDIALGEAVAALGCSQRMLERDCQRRFARTPKRVIRALRVYRTRMRELEGGERPELTPEFAFADLPHYLRDLRAITGLNRAGHRALKSYWLQGSVSLAWDDGRVCQSEAERTQWSDEGERRFQEFFLDSLRLAS